MELKRIMRRVHALFAAIAIFGECRQGFDECKLISGNEENKNRKQEYSWIVSVIVRSFFKKRGTSQVLCIT